MLFLRQLRDEHDLLLELADQLEAATTEAEPAEYTHVFVLLARFGQLLQIHLLREDAIVYPDIINGMDAEAATIALLLQQELGSLDDRIDQFEKRWTGSAIGRGWHDFRIELRILLRELRVRIERENSELYPLVDQRRAA